MKVRLHRGGLAESMGTVHEVHSQAELDQYFAEPVTIDPKFIYDGRSGWNTHYVLSAEKCILGMTDGDKF